MKLAILGAGGCFGLNLARHAIAEGHQVLGIGRSHLKPPCFSLELSRQSESWRYFPYRVGADSEFLVKLLEREKPEVIVNFAAQGEGAASFKPVEHHRFFYETNTTALVDLVAQLHGREWLRHFVHIGTSELYGSVDKPAAEDAPLIPTSPYAVSKAAFDMHLLAVQRALQFPASIVRPSNCYTPGQQLHRIIPRAMLYAATGQKLKLEGGGKSQKSYLHGTDLSRAILLVAAQYPGQIYNVGPDEPTSIREVVELCAAASGVSFDDLAEVAPDRIGQDGRYWLDSSKVKALGWSQAIGWERGLEDMRRWVTLYKSELRDAQQDFLMRA